MWVLSQVSQVRLFPMVEKGSVVHRATIPGPTTDPPLTLVSFLMFTTAIWSIPDLGLTLITVGRRSLDPSFLVTEALPKRTLVPMAGFGWLLSKTAFCNCISFNQFTGYCYFNQWRGCFSCRWLQFLDHQDLQRIFPSFSVPSLSWNLILDLKCYTSLFQKYW